jgi:hypothetical protein
MGGRRIAAGALLRVAVVTIGFAAGCANEAVYAVLENLPPAARGAAAP